jgi:hypothetical protein
MAATTAATGMKVVSFATAAATAGTSTGVAVLATVCGCPSRMAAAIATEMTEYRDLLGLDAQLPYRIDGAGTHDEVPNAGVIAAEHGAIRGHPIVSSMLTAPEVGPLCSADTCVEQQTKTQCHRENVLRSHCKSLLATPKRHASAHLAERSIEAGAETELKQDFSGWSATPPTSPTIQ